MENAYKKLAEKLDQLPNGFPETKSGVELKLLAKLFSTDEAQLAGYLTKEYQLAKSVADEAGIEESKAYSLLKAMVKKGLINLKREQGRGFTFSLMPFVVGFYERQNAKIDKEFADLFEEYYKEAFYKIMQVNPSVHRVIPVEKTIPVNLDVMPYEKASTYLDNAQSWGVLNCICRVQKQLIGEGCDHPLENCLVLSSRPGAFDRTDDIRTITRDEALEILVQADREGLVHSTSNVQDEVEYICNCCICSCGILRGIAEFGNTDSVARSDYYAKVDKNLCNACEICIDRCQFNALKIVDDVCTVDTSFCFGCGLCVTTCSTEALTLEQKKPEELAPPPVTEKEWGEKREKARRG